MLVFIHYLEKCAALLAPTNGQVSSDSDTAKLIVNLLKLLLLSRTMSFDVKNIYFIFSNVLQKH